MSSADYVPGACNIGREEIALRRRGGVLALVATLILLLVLHLLDAGPLWFLLVFVPALGAALGILQASFRFCVHYGYSALFNFGNRGSAQSVIDAAARQQDRNAARRLVGYSLLIAGAVTALATATA